MPFTLKLALKQIKMTVVRYIHSTYAIFQQMERAVERRWTENNVSEQNLPIIHIIINKYKITIRSNQQKAF